MKSLKCLLTFKQRQNVLAARKPHESFDQTLNRLLQDVLNNTPATSNLRQLHRSEKRWRIPTAEGNRERDFELYVESVRSMGFKDTLEDLREQFDDAMGFEDDEFRRLPSEWQHEGDVDLDVVIDLIQAELHRTKKGSEFKLFNLIDLACPRIHRIPASFGGPILERLLSSPLFMRQVSYVAGSGYHGLKLKKL